MTTFRTLARHMADPANILTDAAAMPLRAHGTALRSRAVSDLLRYMLDAGRTALVQLRCHLVGDRGKASCAGC